MTYILTRQPSEPQGTLGKIADAEGNVLCFTMELPWLDNAPYKSCIPAGIYHVIPHDSSAHPNTFEITNVPDRSGILIHAGNVENDSRGCILVGDSIGILRGLSAVLNSKAAMKTLVKTLPGSFTLTIK